jgi:two-component system, OmpR family, KDP operon response regulator KdpE
MADDRMGTEGSAVILCVDDDPQILKALAANLRARGYTPLAAATGEDALTLAEQRRPDAVILDLGLPGISGIEVIDGLRCWTQVPILVLSARDGEQDKIAALDAGADDYVAKPFAIGELFARLRAALRRNRPTEAADIASLTTPDFMLDLATHRVTREGSEVRLTPTEWAIVELLVRHEGRLVTARHLLQTVWGPSYGTETNYLRVHLAHLRRKLEPVPSSPRYFLTDAGVGYRFVRPDVPPSG